MIGSNKFVNGAFNSSVNVFQNKCVASWSNAGVLDEGYLKVVPSDEGSSIVLGVGSLTAGKRYLLRYSLKAAGTLSLAANLRSASYSANTSVIRRKASTTRTENEILFSPSTNESSGSLVFTADAKTTYYLDNIKLYEADATVTNPDDSIRFEYNASKAPKTVSLKGNYVDVKNNKYSNSIVLQPYASAILIKDGGTVTTLTNKSPTVNITSPITNKSYTGPAIINMEATATDVDGKISKVEFYNGSTLLHTEYYTPYTYTWNNVPAGNYTLIAKAYDNSGSVTTSAGVSISVVKLNAPIVFIKTPYTNTSYTGPATIKMEATATDADGKISKVEFYNGSALLHTEYYVPYTYTWNNVSVGNYKLTAKAYDNSGNITTSAGVSISVVNATSMSITSPAYTELLSVTSDTKVINSGGTLNKADISGLANFKLFPNPAINKIQIYFDGLQNNQKVNLSIVDLSGRRLKSFLIRVSGEKIEVDVSSLSTGMYIMSLTGENFMINKNFSKIK
ncbi:MAG: T9SS type A sorting domain-containing protein [Chitinophagaceae bacterium]|nr:T9SS type A sorting domain-containing protein [Chitinophagaceae bacterium]